jgi:amidohydrolase
MAPNDAPGKIQGATHAAQNQSEWMREVRRQLHAFPEVGLNLPATAEVVSGVLQDLGLEVETDSASSGISAVMPGTSGHTVVLRADMDALPLQEKTDLEFRSQTDGSMHACGHDFHTAMLLGAARALSHIPERHTVVFAFQAGEEFDRGAVPLLEHAHLQNTGPARTFALHMHAQQPTGTFFWRPGPFMGFGDWFRIEITGRSGHASAPHLAQSPIPALAHLSHAIDGLTAFDEQPWPTTVATVTEVLSGNSVNVIPQTATLRGTLRGRDESVIARIRNDLQNLVDQAQDRFGVDVRLDLQIGYPAVVNDPDATAYGVALASALDGAKHQQMPQTSMVIEDYSYFLQRWPGAMMYLGAAVPGHTSFNHADDVVFDEEALTVGCAFHVGVATVSP